LEAALKRAIDFLIALAMGPAVLLACVALIIIIRCDSLGPGLFVQTRVGKDGRTFRMLKLRTMKVDTRNLPSHLVASSSLTRLGKTLRRLKLDELPQIWNVLIGDMSFVGPRPCLPTQFELIEERDVRGLLAFRPGITGPGQVMGVDMSQPVRLAEVEAAYFRQAGLRSDFALILRTALGAGGGDMAAR
jgi:lipopolysaccharide/colanic/teichoic acid biosynthesis glycosyltransferase